MEGGASSAGLTPLCSAQEGLSPTEQAGLHTQTAWDGSPASLCLFCEQLPALQLEKRHQGLGQSSGEGEILCGDGDGHRRVHLLPPHRACASSVRSLLVSSWLSGCECTSEPCQAPHKPQHCACTAGRGRPGQPPALAAIKREIRELERDHSDHQAASTGRGEAITLCQARAGSSASPCARAQTLWQPGSSWSVPRGG